MTVPQHEDVLIFNMKFQSSLIMRRGSRTVGHYVHCCFAPKERHVFVSLIRYVFALVLAYRCLRVLYSSGVCRTAQLSQCRQPTINRFYSSSNSIYRMLSPLGLLPGSGKGTVSGKILRDFSFAHISTGDLLRDEIRAGSDVGHKAKRFVDSCTVGDGGYHPLTG